MKEFLAIWIIFQLIVIWLVGWNLAYETENNTYECNKKTVGSKFEYSVIWIIIPLVMFVDNTPIIDYCNKKTYDLKS
jgi:hypothetical protein